MKEFKLDDFPQQTQSRLPVTAYPDWSRFLKALWLHGMSVNNIDPVLVDIHCDRALVNIKSSMLARNEVPRVRPSAFLACARQTYFQVCSGEPAEKMPDNIGPTFAVGHLLHELSYAAVKSALPEGFSVDTEKVVSMPDWWPEDYTRFNQEGHVDMWITVDDPFKAAKYLPDDAPKAMLIDFKTMGGYSYKKHGKTLWGEDADGFGYLAQLSVYAAALSESNTEMGAIIAGINRDSLTQPLLPRYIEPEVLTAEANRVRVAIEMALEKTDPGEEFLIRHEKEAYFYCGRGGRPGYCPFRTKCAAEPSRETAKGSAHTC